MKHRIHVNRHVIVTNARHGTDEPAITVKTYKSNDRTKEARILDKEGNVVAVVKQSTKPLSCGARVWVETENEVQIT